MFYDDIVTWFKPRRVWIHLHTSQSFCLKVLRKHCGLPNFWDQNWNFHAKCTAGSCNSCWMENSVIDFVLPFSSSFHISMTFKFDYFNHNKLVAPATRWNREHKQIITSSTCADEFIFLPPFVQCHERNIQGHFQLTYSRADLVGQGRIQFHTVKPNCI